MPAMPGVLLDPMDLEFPHRYLRFAEAGSQILCLSSPRNVEDRRVDATR